MVVGTLDAEGCVFLPGLAPVAPYVDGVGWVTVVQSNHGDERDPIPCSQRQHNTIILGSSCVKVEEALATTIDDEDDCEYFITAWCVHLDLIQDEKIIAIPQP